MLSETCAKMSGWLGVTRHSFICELKMMGFRQKPLIERLNEEFMFSPDIKVAIIQSHCTKNKTYRFVHFNAKFISAPELVTQV